MFPLQDFALLQNISSSEENGLGSGKYITRFLNCMCSQLLSKKRLYLNTHSIPQNLKLNEKPTHAKNPVFEKNGRSYEITDLAWRNHFRLSFSTRNSRSVCQCKIKQSLICNHSQIFKLVKI